MAAAGWLDHSTAGAGGLEGASAGCGPSEPRTADWLSPRTRGSRRRWVGFPHGRRRDLPRTAGSVSRRRRRELRSELAFPANDDQRAWVSGNPASLSQRQSGGHWVSGRPAGIESAAGIESEAGSGLGGGIESAAGRWARVSRGWWRHLLWTVGWLIRERRRELPRMAGWLSRERRRELPRTAGWESRERRRKLPQTAGWESRKRRRKLPRTAGWESRERREWGLAACGLACREGQNTGTNKTLEKTNKTKRGEGTTLTVWSGLLSQCTQQGETRNTQTRRYFKIIVFHDNIKGRQGKVDTPGITSRPDEVEFKRQDLNTHSQTTHTWTRII